MTPQRNKPQEIFRQVYRIRRFEEMVLDAFPSGLFYGTTHTYLGQEANAVGVLSHISEDDIVFSNHRCHGHFIAYGGDLRALFAELMGKSTGVGGGRGGSQHIHWKNFYSNGVLGSTAPVATGAALAEKNLKKGSVTVLFLGDGSLGQGVVYESMNIASLWGAPILFVIENNHIAQTTPIEQALAGDIADRFTAFNIPSTELDSSDTQEIFTAAEPLFADIRDAKGPQAFILHTQRFGPHSKGDDTRSEKEIAKIRNRRDPVKIAAKRVDTKILESIKDEVEVEVRMAFEEAKKDPVPSQ